ncbi:flagellar hook assembly protein FlgD [Pseudodesulfovibrio piezophilus]|uniref:Basal-body rod modification protein FlgD n=1 Tax=Pseudodesulfovibrio piezophilus (strain DSM 21447 / JCM 15486 / C1TLV30) TaxID=1322246 RepID=M1WTE7_PSEP2|nr:flagellar hook capping FlgD N-terminal domain-containing protein [Pseudodesulfovibrio piezophilus]CCH49502.1 Flagellar hook capping protein [Pseudodesulfovibrio piezophilus C1TLV30]
MTVETTSYYDSLTTATTETTTTTSDSSTSLTSDDFITLLLAELEYQDPTEPVDNSQMVDQMTQYSQLEQLTEMNDQLESMTETISSASMTTALNYIGMEVTAEGYTLSKSGEDLSDLYFETTEDAETLTADIYDSSGNIVQTLTYSNVDAGSYELDWDGTDSDGEDVDDGYYYVIMTGENSEGDTIDVTTTTTGTVSGLSNTDDGVILTLEDGRTVNMLNVTYATS